MHHLVEQVTHAVQALVLSAGTAGSRLLQVLFYVPFPLTYNPSAFLLYTV